MADRLGQALKRRTADGDRAVQQPNQGGSEGRIGHLAHHLGHPAANLRIAAVGQPLQGRGAGRITQSGKCQGSFQADLFVAGSQQPPQRFRIL